MACATEPHLLLAAVLLCGACAAGTEEPRCVGPGSPVSATVGEPVQARFVELWRSGSAEEDEQLGYPLSLAVSPSGRAAAADFMLRQVLVYEADGRVTSLARRGRGPGELTLPLAAVWDDDGALHVFDIERATILRYDAALRFIGEQGVDVTVVSAIRDRGELGWAGIQPSGALVIVPAIDPAEGRGHEVVVRHAADAAPDTLSVATFPLLGVRDTPMMPAPGFARVLAAVGAGGHLAVAGSADYRFTVYDADGSPRFTVCSSVQGDPLSPEERGARGPAQFSALVSAYASAPRPDEPAAIGRIVMGADGTIWVQRERPHPWPDDARTHGNPGATFDVFDGEGRYMRTLRLPPRARLQGVLGDTIWAYEVSNLDEVSIAAYRVQLP
jgi:hypothetical protein